ncbi:MAG: indolepyruvate oxidoreductase subunit beta [Bacteriovoracaceae bacterium]|nr:indolepyruvate oxidoreductase subunit beta [Bacteriovoracaceae bacterium]
MTEKVFTIVVAGVGGQGAITVAQLVLGAAWKAGYHTIQSEVHGMSQRGGSVNAQILFSKAPVTSPILLEGSGDVLLGIEPLETLRYLPLMSEDALVASSMTPVINMAGYPDVDQVIAEVKKVEGIITVDTDAVAKELENRHAGNVVLLGVASKKMPFSDEIWEQVFTERFKAKGDAVIQKNLVAFRYGQKL